MDDVTAESVAGYVKQDYKNTQQLMLTYRSVMVRHAAMSEEVIVTTENPLFRARLTQDV